MTGLPPPLLSAVLADPEDDAPRLVCADWLDENGRPEDAAFVRAQLRLARRAELRLSTKEVSRLQAEIAAAIEAHQARWLAPLGLAADTNPLTVWDRGFLATLHLECKRPADAEVPLARLGEYPELRAVEIDCLKMLPASALEPCLALSNLDELTLIIDLLAGDDALVARLAAHPRLATVHLWRHDSDGRHERVLNIPGWDGPQFTAARTAYLETAPPAELVAALNVAHMCARTRDGRLSVWPARNPLIENAAVMGRVPNVACVQYVGPSVPGWLAAHPGLLGLTLEGLTAFDARPLAGLRGLRHVRFHGPALRDRDWEPVADWLVTLPRLASLELAWPHARVPAAVAERLAARPGLRLLLIPSAGRVEPVEVPPPGGPTDVAGLPIAVPGCLRRVADAPPVGDAQTLATWCEWGDGDPDDRLAPGGPLWATLERVPGPVKAADAPRVLCGPPGSLDARSPRWDTIRTANGRREVGGNDAFARHLRFLWLGRKSALRLRFERPHVGRMIDGEGVARALADAVASVGA